MFNHGFNGFSITYENGTEISVRWGPGNYCEARMMNIDYSDPKAMDAKKSSSAEIAIIYPDGEWHKFRNDTVEGWVGADDVLGWMNYASKHTTQTKGE